MKGIQCSQDYIPSLSETLWSVQDRLVKAWIFPVKKEKQEAADVGEQSCIISSRAEQLIEFFFKLDHSPLQFSNHRSFNVCERQNVCQNTILNWILSCCRDVLTYIWYSINKTSLFGTEPCKSHILNILIIFQLKWE